MERNTDLVKVATEVQRQLKSRRDFVAPAPAIELEVEDPAVAELTLKVGDNRFGIKPHAHNQIAQHLDIPARFYHRLAEKEPNLLATTVNTLFAHDYNDKGEIERRMVRTLDDNVRAVVSPSFFCLDNYDLLEHLLPTINGMNGKILNCQLTDRHLYLTVTDPGMKMLVPGSKRVGDVVECGAIVGNSEIGDGSLFVKGYMNYLVCLNGATREDARFKRHHLGKSVESDAEVRELLSNEARQADARAIFLKLRDVFRALFDRARFEAYVNRIAATTQDAIEVGKAEKIVDLTVTELKLPEASKQGILTELIKSGDFSRYGLMNAITFQSHEAETEEAVDFEKAGGKVIELSPTKWKRIADGREATERERDAEDREAA